MNTSLSIFLRLKPLDPFEWVLLVVGIIALGVAYLVRQRMGARATKGLLRQAQIRGGVFKG